MLRNIIKLIIFIIFIFLIMYLLDNIKAIQKKFYVQDYKEHIEKYANENELDVFLVYAIVKGESGFDSKAVSKSGAVGLMQLMDNTAKEVANRIHIKYDENTLYDPESNIQIGTRYFSELMKKYDQNIYISLAAYNAGQGTVDKWISEERIQSDGSDIENIPYKETNNYVRKIMKNYEKYQKLYKEE